MILFIKMVGHAPGARSTETKKERKKDRERVRDKENERKREKEREGGLRSHLIQSTLIRVIYHRVLLKSQ